MLSPVKGLEGSRFRFLGLKLIVQGLGLIKLLGFKVSGFRNKIRFQVNAHLGFAAILKLQGLMGLTEGLSRDDTR